MPERIAHAPFTDICIGGIEHHLLCCDDFSTHLQSFPLKSNNDTILAVTLTIAFYKQHGCTIKVIHSDGRGAVFRLQDT